MLTICRSHLKSVYDEILQEVSKLRKQLKQRTAWRIEGTLREFPKFDPINLWFDYPVHRQDTIGVLKDVDPDDMKPWKKNFTKKKHRMKRKRSVSSQSKQLMMPVTPTGSNDKKSVRISWCRRKNSAKTIEEHGGFWVDEGVIGKKT